MTTRSGKADKQGRKTRKRFADAAAACRAADKLVATKTGQGYVEKRGGHPLTVAGGDEGGCG
jgi:predicted DNA-binding WGR domain protein